MAASPTRLAADRIRRIWAIAQEIADAPGHSRPELAARFFLSERQVQADLNLVRDALGLPLIRRHGYRFAEEGGAAGPSTMTIQNALTLVAALGLLASSQRAADRSAVADAARRLPLSFPAHLAPLATRLFATVGKTGGADRGFLAVCEAMRAETWVGLRPAVRAGRFHYAETRVLRPELVLPLYGGWYALGATLDGKERMVCLDNLEAVEPHLGPSEARASGTSGRRSSTCAWSWSRGPGSVGSTSR